MFEFLSFITDPFHCCTFTYFVLFFTAVYLVGCYEGWWINKPKKRKIFTVPPCNKLHIVTDRETRRARLKRKFNSKLLASDYDVIVVGSGMGGMTCASLLAKAGKRVLVLEKIKIGGCTHTYAKKGFEFDVGVHYVGNMEHGSLNRFLLDSLTDGRLKWADIDKVFDTIVIGEEKFDLASGYDEAQRSLAKRFPGQENAIKKYFKLLIHLRQIARDFAMLKMIPMWVIRVMKTLRLHKYFFSDYITYSTQTVEQVVNGITDDPKLRAVLSYCFGDYGTVPSQTPFLMHALLMNHFVKRGGFYPIGGASEIAYHMIPGIEAAGGAVMAGANVTSILFDGLGHVRGVLVNGSTEVQAKQVVSATGIFNTFDKLVGSQLVAKHRIREQISGTKVATSFMQVFVGLDGTSEELDLPKRQFWVFNTPELDRDARNYLAMDKMDAVNSEIPLLFISFPSAKDRTYDMRHPGKSTCAIVTFANIEWFREWQSLPVHKRGHEYDSLKTAFGEQAWQQVLRLFPNLKDKVAYFEVGSPLTHSHYITAPNGEIYGVDHDMGRFEFDQATRLRPETSIKGLYLTGQDIFTCGFIGATFGGLLTASAMLDRNLLTEMGEVIPEYRAQIRKFSHQYKD